jgi:hypothetical protein
VVLFHLSDPDGVKSLVALPAKNLEVLRTMVVFAEVSVVCVERFTAAQLTATPCSYPCFALRSP